MKKVKIEYSSLIILTFIGIFFLCNYFDKNNAKEINLDGIPYNENITLSIDKIQKQDNRVTISGLAFDQKEVYEYDNWITGKGKNIYLNYDILIETEGKIYKVFTNITNNSLTSYNLDEKIDLTTLTYEAIFDSELLNEDSRVGILLYSKNGNKSYCFLAEELNYER